jgi:hypothetical protein
MFVLGLFKSSSSDYAVSNGRLVVGLEALQQYGYLHHGSEL